MQVGMRLGPVRACACTGCVLFACTQGPEQLVGMLEVQLANENWGAIMHLMHLSSFMARCEARHAMLSDGLCKH